MIKTENEAMQHHIEQLLALGYKEEELPLILRREEETGISFVAARQLDLEQPWLLEEVKADAEESGFVYDDLSDDDNDEDIE